MRKYKRLSDIERENYRKYHKRGCSPLHGKCKVNAIVLEGGKNHMIKVLEICLELIKKDHKFLTECVPNSNPKRRYDIVDISVPEGLIIEVEDSGKLKEDFDVSYVLKDNNWEVITKS